MKRFILYFLFLFLTGFQLMVFSQVNPNHIERVIRSRMSRYELQVMDEADEFVKEATDTFNHVLDQNLERELNDTRSQRKKRRLEASREIMQGKRMLITAGKIAQEAYRLKYSVYDNKLFSMGKSEHLEVDTMIDAGIVKLDKYRDINNDKLENISFKTVKSDISEIIGMFKADVASVEEYLYESLDDVIWKETTEKDVLDAYYHYLEQFPEGKHVAEANQRIREIKNPPVATTHTEPETEVSNTEVDFTPSSEVNYHIQVLAVSKKIPNARFHRFYPKSQPLAEQVITIYDENSGFYKYILGKNIKTYREAEEAKDAVNRYRKDAFIVAFKDNEQLTTAQAIRLTDDPAYPLSWDDYVADNESKDETQSPSSEREKKKKEQAYDVDERPADQSVYDSDPTWASRIYDVTCNKHYDKGQIIKTTDGNFKVRYSNRINEYDFRNYEEALTFLLVRMRCE